MRYLFGDYLLDPQRRELSRGDEPVALGPKVFDLLLYLLRHRERVVGKDELLEAVWNGRIVSESTITSHVNAVRKAVGDDGASQRLVRTVARKGFRFVAEVREDAAGADLAAPGGQGLWPPPQRAVEAAPALPDRPSIAALPFLNLSGDPEQEYFADGVVEDVIAALSRIGWLFVVARNSSFTYKGRAVDVKQVGRELGVRYVLEGSLRKSHDRVRMMGQLVDAVTGAQLWGERFEGTLDDIFDLQDRLATAVVGAIAPQLERAEIVRAHRKPTENLDAYDYYLRGIERVHRGSREAITEALSLFRSAIERDPEFASAYAMAAWCHFWRKINGWMVARECEMVEGADLARRAIELGRNDAVALARSGHALAHLAGDLDGGIALIDRALMLNPNLAAAWFLGGFVRLWRGEPEAAIERFAHAMRLSPLDPETYRMQAGTAMGHMLAGRFEEASDWAEKAFRELPSFLIAAAIAAASHAHAERPDEARRAMAHLRRLDPALRLSNIAEWLPFRNADDLACFAEGLRRAGLPE